MNKLQSGQYFIVPAGQTVPVGANIQGPVAPVVAAGSTNKWLIRANPDGKYAILLQVGGGSLLSQPGGDDVIVGIMPGPAWWAIQPHGTGVYTIEAPSDIPTRKWTLKDTTPGTKVELCATEYPATGQYWKFIPAS